jgi:hypothetical protein
MCVGVHVCVYAHHVVRQQAMNFLKKTKSADKITGSPTLPVPSAIRV